MPWRQWPTATRNFARTRTERRLRSISTAEGTALADVFIACSERDHERVKPIAERLGSLGYSTWWDKHANGRQAAFGEQERELEAAKCVLVVWSHTSRNGSDVVAQASHAVDTNKLLQVRTDTNPPPPFDAYPIADLSSEQWGVLEAALAKLVRDGVAPQPLRAPQGVGPLATASAAGAPKLVTLALGATMFAYAGAVSATSLGVMSPEQLQVALTGMIGVGGVCGALSAHRLLTIERAGS